MPEMRVIGWLSCDEEEEVGFEEVGSGEEVMLWVSSEVQRCWYCRLWSIWVVVAARGLSDAPADDMSFVRDEGSGATGFVFVLAILLAEWI